jgi:hypothetical protein
MIAIARQLVAARPFRPFRLVLTGGSEVPVTRPDRIIFPDPETAEVRTGDGLLHVIDVNHLIEIRS